MLKIPHPVVCVAIGLIAGVLHIIPSGRLSADLFMFVFLPPLLFEAAWNLDLDELKRNWLPVTLLASVGSCITMAVTAAILTGSHQLDFSAALVFGAIIAATDPVSVVAVFRRLGVHPRLLVLVEGESLFNDGIAIALFNLAVAAAMQHGQFSLGHAGWQFVVIVFGGTLIGAVVGWLAVQIARRVLLQTAEIVLTAFVAYATFWAAEHLHVSPVMAVVTAAIIIGNAAHREISRKTFVEIDDFWTVVALVVNSLVFFLIGLEATTRALLEFPLLICVGIGATLVARGAVVWPLCGLASLRAEKIPANWQTLIYWGGLRGALSMLMALTLPHDIANRRELIVLTFGVVLFTLLVQGLTVEPLLRLLKIKSPEVAPLEEAAQPRPSE